jgi:hypothetical protein
MLSRAAVPPTLLPRPTPPPRESLVRSWCHYIDRSPLVALGKVALHLTLILGIGPTVRSPKDPTFTRIDVPYLFRQISPAAFRLPLLRRAILPQLARVATCGTKQRVAALTLIFLRPLVPMTAPMTNSGKSTLLLIPFKGPIVVA